MMKINRNMTVSELNEQFHGQFPHLKIAFFQSKHDKFQGSFDVELVPDDTSLEMLNSELREGSFSINEEMSVADFEAKLESEHGLHIQVYRKSGSQWLQTTVTDNWSLHKQEDKAEEQESYKR